MLQKLQALASCSPSLRNRSPAHSLSLSLALVPTSSMKLHLLLLIAALWSAGIALGLQQPIVLRKTTTRGGSPTCSYRGAFTGGSGGSEELRIARLHSSARKAIKKGRLESARNMYGHILHQFPQPSFTGTKDMAQTYLLLALLEQRTGNYDGARAAFEEGIRKMPWHSAQLLQAYALFESRQGDMQHALQLVRHAVTKDPSLKPVLRWRMFKEAAKRIEVASEGC